MNLLIIGHRQHGKTDVGKILAKAMNTTAHDSSWYVAENVVYPKLKEKYGYTSAAECHADRGNHRQEWFEIIEDYNHEPDRLTRAILSEGSIYVGMRSRMEFIGSKHHFDYVVWVDASKRAPLESQESMRLGKEDADYVLDNNGSKEDLLPEIGRFLLWLTTQSESRQVASIDPVHYAARDILHQYVMENLVSGIVDTKQNFEERH